MRRRFIIKGSVMGGKGQETRGLRVSGLDHHVCPFALTCIKELQKGGLILELQRFRGCLACDTLQGQ